MSLEPLWTAGPDIRPRICCRCERVERGSDADYMTCGDDGCLKPVCDRCAVVLEVGVFCSKRCAHDYLEAHEPECECKQTDVDLYDARGCPCHDPKSAWNTALRCTSDVERYLNAVERKSI